MKCDYGQLINNAFKVTEHVPVRFDEVITWRKSNVKPSLHIRLGVHICPNNTPKPMRLHSFGLAASLDRPLMFAARHNQLNVLKTVIEDYHAHRT